MPTDKPPESFKTETYTLNTLALQLGTVGGQTYSGFDLSEFLPELTGVEGRRKFKQMYMNDPIIGAFFRAIEGLFASVNWRVDTPQADVDGTMQAIGQRMIDEMDSDYSFDVWLQGTHSRFIYGFAVFEIVAKKMSDGYIGIKKLAPRDQHTIYEFIMDTTGVVRGFVQRPPTNGRGLDLPVEKCVYLRTSRIIDRPEGMSLLRHCYQPWRYKQDVQVREYHGIDRDLNGLPVLYVPPDDMGATDEEKALKRMMWQKLVSNTRLDKTSGVVLSSETYPDQDGKPTNVPKYRLELVASNSTRSVDTSGIITRYDQAIAMSLLADFLTLGSGTGKGSYALSKEKTDFFFESFKGYVDGLCAAFNDQVFKRLWEINALPMDLCPKLTYDNLQKQDLDILGAFLSAMAGVGIQLSDDETVQYLRKVSGLPMVEQQQDAADPDVSA